MAESGVKGDAGEAAQTAAEKQLLRRRQELDYWQRNATRLRRRNLVTGLAIGAFVVGMCILRPVSVSPTGHILRNITSLCSLKIHRKTFLFFCFFFFKRVKQMYLNVNPEYQGVFFLFFFLFTRSFIKNATSHLQLFV